GRAKEDRVPKRETAYLSRTVAVPQSSSFLASHPAAFGTPFAHGYRLPFAGGSARPRHLRALLRRRHQGGRDAAIDVSRMAHLCERVVASHGRAGCWPVAIG